MKLSKRDVELFSRPEILFMPFLIFAIYTCPLAYGVINAIVKGRFGTEFKDGMWGMLLWGGAATLFAIYFVIVFFVARKQKREG